MALSLACVCHVWVASRYVLQGEQCSPQQIVNSLDRMTQHAAGLQARAAVAMTRASGDQAGCALPSPPSPLAQAVKDLHPSPPAATEVDGGVMDADFAKHQFDLRQSMQMYVKCGDSHIRLVDLMSVILGSSVAGEVKENIRKEIGAVEAAKKIAEAQIQQPRRHGWQEAAVKDPTCKQAEGQEGSAGAAAATGPMRSVAHCVKGERGFLL